MVNVLPDQVTVYLEDILPDNPQVVLRWVQNPDQMQSYAFLGTIENYTDVVIPGPPLPIELGYNFDIVAGLDNATLNPLVASLYKLLPPIILGNSFSISNAGISEVVYSITQPPTINLGSSEGAVKYFTDLLVSNTSLQAAKISPNDKKRLFDLLVGASFELNIPVINLSVVFIDRGNPTQSINTSCNATVAVQTANIAGTNSLTFAILAADMYFSSDPTIQGAMEEYFVPLFISYLNDNLLSAIQIPAIQYRSLVISMPVPMNQNPFLVAYSAVGAIQPDIPPTFPLPSGCVFVGLDSNFLSAATNIFANFPLEVSKNFDQYPFNGQVGAQLLVPTFTFNDDGTISATLIANVSGGVTYHTPSPFPNISVSATSTPTITATAQPSFLNGQLSIKITEVIINNLSFSFDGAGIWQGLFDGVASTLEGLLASYISPIIASALNNLPKIPLYTIPTISFSILNQKIDLNITPANTSSQNSLLMINAQATITAGASINKTDKLAVA